MLRKYRRGRVWYVRGTVRGVSVHETTGTADTARAEEYRARREAQIWDRSVKGERGSRSFGEAALIYLQGADFSPSYRATLRRIVAHFERWPCDRVDQTAVDEYIAEHHPFAAPATIIKAVVTPTTAVLRVAALRGWCDRPTLARPKVRNKPARWLRQDEAARLVEAAAPHLRPLLVFLVHTGARLGEALRLEWRDVDLGARRVSFLETKNGETRGAPLNENAFLALANLARREGRVFLTPDGRPYHDTRPSGGGSPIKTAFATARRKAGIEAVRVHDLRHTYASWLVMAGVPLRTVAELLGHKSLTMVARYAHLCPDHMADAVAKIESRAKPAQEAKTPSQHTGTKG